MLALPPFSALFVQAQSSCSLLAVPTRCSGGACVHSSHLPAPPTAAEASRSPPCRGLCCHLPAMAACFGSREDQRDSEQCKDAGSCQAAVDAPSPPHPLPPDDARSTRLAAMPVCAIAAVRLRATSFDGRTRLTAMMCRAVAAHLTHITSLPLAPNRFTQHRFTQHLTQTHSAAHPLQRDSSSRRLRILLH